MTKAQQVKVDFIRHEMETLFSNYEIKDFEVTDHKSFVAVYAISGMIEDEGTMAEVICRESAHVFIGKRGGITYPVYNWKTQTSSCRPYKFMLKTVLDQKKGWKR